ncbi:insulin-like peptide INSL5 [Sceloporus undulatus]|uniref:insulin-like peptide INSL5 n=1 Tax=Sceloporus undulatus TaxID=8520 RepID=UPI001C4CE2BE|nr:insulin-like peptide INSL5 [Sceloporus undulatus]
MKAMVLGLFLLSFFIAISEVKSEGAPVRLCGRDFVRAVVFTCGGSRWRRQLNGFPKGLIDQYSHLPLAPEENSIQKSESQSQEFIQSRAEAERDLQGQQQKSIHKRHEDVMRLTVSCCAIGCSENSISTLC